MTDRRSFWRPRFSLRTLLLLTALVAVIAGWFTQTALRQRRAVAEITKHRANVLYEHKTDPQSMLQYPEWLQNWLGVDFFAEATEVQFRDSVYNSTAFNRRNARLSIVVGDASRSVSTFPSGMVILSAATSSSPVTISEEVVRQLCDLPYLRKLTIGALTANQMKVFAASRNPYPGVLVDEFVLDTQALQLLRDHPTLRELDLRSMPADDEVLAGLHGFRGLQRLSLGVLECSAQGGQHLATLTNLKELTFGERSPYPVIASSDKSQSRVDSSVLESLPVLPGLRQLSIPGFAITNKLGPLLARFPGLQKLECDSIRVDDEGIRYFGELTQLRELNLVDSRITDVGAVQLAKLTNLHRLILTNNRLTDDGMRHLSTLTKLETLYLPHLPLTDAGLAHLRGLSEMKVLVLSGTKITDDGLQHLLGMTELTSLDLSFTAISDNAIDSLLRFKKLRYLRLLGTNVTRQAASVMSASTSATIVMPDAADPR